MADRLRTATTPYCGSVTAFTLLFYIGMALLVQLVLLCI
jgi:hypothetical protein